LKGTPLLARPALRVLIECRYRVEPTGNLQSFEIAVKSHESSETLTEIKGRLKGKKMEIVSRGPIPILNKTLTVDYEPRSLFHDALGPIDRLPGLHVGQKWESRVVNPFTGQVDSVRVEVARKGLIHWNGNPVTTFEVVQYTTPLAMRTWARLDGVILRQEVPFPFVRLVLERRPDEEDFASIPKTRVPGP
jgi:hypothetical protein